MQVDVMSRLYANDRTENYLQAFSVEDSKTSYRIAEKSGSGQITIQL